MYIKRITFLSLLFVLMIASSVQAHEWLYDFVVLDGKVYEVKEEEIIDESKIGKIIGKVKTQPYSDTSTSAQRYYGNASNVYPIGTLYYKIKGISPSTAIAIKDDTQWVKAIYVDNAPFHKKNILTNSFFICSIVIIPLVLIGLILRIKNPKHRNQGITTKKPY